ncbi:sulfite exporter TauE/SafE family protein [Alcaligenaceae bacterium CGII-47]|nr:sulfite exporter TauE/SafE family protein [Alcaligenaceae bacterium CGII-47]
MLIVPDLLFYVVAVPAVLLIGISKGGFAGGLGVLAVPMMALAISPRQAAGIMLPILCVMDVTGFRIWVGRCDWALLRRLLPGALLGIFVGALTFQFVSDTMLKLMVGVLALVFTLNHWFKAHIRVPAHRRLPDTVSSMFWSVLSGFTSFMAHAGGPPIMIYLLPRQIDRSVLVGTATIYFAVVNYVKLVPYVILGQLGAENLLTSLVLAPVAVLGVAMGAWLHDRVDQILFFRLLYGFLFVTGLKLCWDGIGL